MNRQLATGLTVAVLLSACNPSPTPSGRAVKEETAASTPPAVTQVYDRPAEPTPRLGHAERKAPSARPAVADPASLRRVPASAPLDRERYAPIESHGVMSVGADPVSTFSIDVDTGSYANVRRMLQEGRLPPRDAVRVEELVNYFAYADPAPDDREVPFRVTAQVAPAPWNPDSHLLRVALKAWSMPPAQLPASNLVFLIDVSGSMASPDKLPLLQRSIKLLTRKLRPQDRITLVVYAGAAGVVLEPTAGDRQATIESALDRLSAGGSTHGSAGIQLAYAKAREAFIAGGVNRVILATDGDFNVGTVDQRALLDLIEREREGGISLTTLGFGRGNLNDQLIEQLADHGNGSYAYIDTLLEAQKVLVEQMGGTLLTVASDVKVQIEFNPARVAGYRLIGYENRALRREDFNNDRVDAGELGAGHSVVALYELDLVGGRGSRLDPLRYAPRAAVPPGSHGGELAFVKLRYKPSQGADSRLLTLPVDDALRVDTLSAASEDLRFSAAVAAFAQRLRGATYLNGFSYQDILALARGARGSDPLGHRADFVRLVGLAEGLDPRVQAVTAGTPDDGNG